MAEKSRLSNFELLRIIAMLMIVLLHCNYWMLGGLDRECISANPFGSFWRIFTEQICIVGANVFVMISGWFGIRTTIKGGVNFIYQIFFHSLLVLLIAWPLGASISGSQVLQSLSLGSWNWFVPCYLGLYILSPALNSLVENTSLRFQTGIISAFFVFEFLYGWLLTPNYFGSGYSIISFVGLYLFARHLRQREDLLQKKSCFFYFLLYAILTIIPSCISYFGIKYTGHSFAMIDYSNPLVIAASTFFFLGFYKLTIVRYKGIINWMASSMFAVIMIHVHPVIAPYFRNFMQGLHNKYNDIQYTLFAICIAIVIMLICVVVDQPRKSSWGYLSKRLLKHI